MKITKSKLACIFLETDPHIPIIRNIGINKLSNKIKKVKMSKTIKENKIKISKIKSNKTYSLIKNKCIFQVVRTHKQTITEVNNKKLMDKPSIPKPTEANGK